MSKKHFYALSDSFSGDNPLDYTSGFANTKYAIAFSSRKERDAWVADTKLLTAKALTRSQASHYAEFVYDDTNYVILKESFYCEKFGVKKYMVE